MDIYMVLFRLIHIFSGIIWVGFALFMMLVIVPMARKAGADAGPFMWRLLKQTRYSVLIGMAAGLTTLAGILLYVHSSNNFDADWMKSAQGIVLSVGAVFGVLALGHGATAMSSISAKYGSALDEVMKQGRPPTDAQSSQLQALAAKMGVNSRISMALVLISVVCMISFRYVG